MSALTELVREMSKTNMEAPNRDMVSTTGIGLTKSSVQSAALVWESVPAWEILTVDETSTPVTPTPTVT